MDLPQPPQDTELRNIIDKLAQFVARNGPEFEQMTKNKQKGNPKFQFLYGGEYYNYYQYKVSAEQALHKQQQQQNVIQPQQNIWSLPTPTVNGDVEHITQQIETLQEQIKQSEHNLQAQHAVLLQQQQTQMETVILESEKAELQKEAEDSQISLDELHQILQPIVDSCTKDSIQTGKSWILQHATNRTQAFCIAHCLLQKAMQPGALFPQRLHVIYLVNDVLHHCARKNAADLKDALESVVVAMFCGAANAASDEQRLKLDKLLQLWESKANYLAASTVEALRRPQESLQQYISQQMAKYGGEIARVTQATFEGYRVQHQAFVCHATQQIQEFELRLSALEEQQQQQQMQQHQQLQQHQMSPQQSHMQKQQQQPPPPPPSSVQQQQQQQQQPPQLQPPQLQPPQLQPPQLQPPQLQPPQLQTPQHQPPQHQPPQHQPPQHQPPQHQPPQHQPPQHQPPQHQPPQHQPPQLPPPQIQTPQLQPPPQTQQPPPTHITPQIPPPTMNTSIPPPQFNQPPPGFFSPPGLFPDFSKPPPGFLPQPEPPVPEELMPSLPYYELPAGLMVPLIKLEDTAFKSLDPSAIRLPPPAPPNERLLAAVEAFYAPPSHERPRDSEGWEKLGLYEYYKAKNIAKKEKEEQISAGYRNKSRSPSPIQVMPDKSPSPPRRRYVSRSPTPSRRSRSRSPRRQRRSRSSRSRKTRSPSPRSRSRTPSPIVPALVVQAQEQLDSSNKGHQMLKRMGWGGSGLGAHEQGIDAPISGGDVRDRQDQFKGVGCSLNDPYENFRKNKGAAFITRMKARAEERAQESRAFEKE